MNCNNIDLMFISKFFNNIVYSIAYKAKVLFFSFPNDDATRRKWLLILSKENIIIRKNTCICISRPIHLRVLRV